jgi:hypothetical protein
MICNFCVKLIVKKNLYIPTKQFLQNTFLSLKRKLRKRKVCRLKSQEDREFKLNGNPCQFRSLYFS